MLSSVLQPRIREYSPANAIEQENMLAELMQHYVLASLSRSGLFSAAMFHGGTCLRICHSMNRFSEDLDFLLKQPDRQFVWEPHLQRIAADCEAEGLRIEIQDKSHAVGAVRKAFVKTDSIGSVVTLDLPFERVSSRKVRIRLEIDINPPQGSSFETSYLTPDHGAAHDANAVLRVWNEDPRPAVPPRCQGTRLVRLPLVRRAPDRSRPDAARERPVATGVVARPALRGLVRVVAPGTAREDRERRLETCGRRRSTVSSAE